MQLPTNSLGYRTATALILLAVGSTAIAETKLQRHELLPETPFATEVLSRRAERAGPTVVIVGGMHGNEPAGAAAAQQISRWQISRGTLICIPRANGAALEAGQRRTPDSPAELADLNRNFPPAKSNEAAEGELALEIWRTVSAAKPDWLIDLHEGFAVHRQNPNSVGSSVIGDTSGPTTEVARELLARVNASLPEERQFVLLGPPVDSSLARAAHEHLGANAMILETTYNGAKLPVRVRQQRLMVHRLLERLDMLAEDVTVESGLLPSGSEEKIRVALYNDAGVGGNGVGSLLEQLGDNGQYRVAQVCGADVAAGALSGFDLLICSGGSGSGQARSLGETGREEVRRFVREGGDFIGICAGSYLACRGFSWGLGILDAKTASSQWRRGRSPLEVELSQEARSLFAWSEPSATLLYHNGPILVPLDDPQIPDFVPLATFAEEVAQNGTPAGIMIGTPAIVRGDFGRGQVFCISPHPEQTKNCEQWLPLSVKRLAELPAE